MMMKKCCVCAKKLKKKDTVVLCELCHAVQFCSDACQEIAHEDLSQHGHSTWCGKMKLYMAEEYALADLPFSFVKETTSASFTDSLYAKFLKDAGVYGYGYWRHEANYWMNHGDPLFSFGCLPRDENPYVLPVETMILEDDIEYPAENMPDWETYYRLRSFRLDSPIAVLMQYPMTLYHVWTNYLLRDFPTSSKGVMTIGILGVEKECDMMETFYEIAKLCPDWSINLHMFGPELSPKVDGSQVVYKNMSITIHKKLLHNFNGETFDFVIGFNAGLGAYMSWKETLKTLRASCIPAYFTDYCQYSCEVSRQAVEGLGVGTISQPQINPFRAPVRMYCKDHNMPMYSNGFLYHLIYPDTEQ